MRAQAAIITVCGMAGGLFGATAAIGDYECVEGYRDTTASERSTMTAVLEAARGALPAAPEGWVILGDDSISVATSLCQDFEGDGWTYGYSREYQRVDDQAARDEAMNAAGANMAAAIADKQPQLDALMARSNELSAELAAAGEKGDFEKAETIRQELEKVGEEYQNVMFGGTAAAQMNETIARASQDLSMSIVVAVNRPYDSPGLEAQRTQVPGGYPAFRWSSTRGEVNEDHVLILLGEWQPGESGELRSVRRPGTPFAAHTIAVYVTADASRIVQMVESIDFSGMAATLVH